MVSSLEEYVKEKQMQRARELIRKLNKATIAYEEGSPIMSDKEWDDMYFELARLEEQTDIIFPDSPVRTIYFTTISELKKVEHDHLMLSLDKSKDIEVIKSFLKPASKWIGMCKMDGLTCSLTYINGKLEKAETRGNGKIGEDITHNAKVIRNIPPVISRIGKVVIDGEIICTYKNFEEFKDKYANPRNFAAGSIRLLDSAECHNRKLSFIAWDIIEGDPNARTLSTKLSTLISLGFTAVPWTVQDNLNWFENAVEYLKDRAKECSYPIDGLVFKYDNINEYEVQGKTEHHFKGGIAYKFYDDVYESRLQTIHWSMGRTGILTPVAVFDPIDMEGSMVSRASLHNVSVMREILGDCAYVGEPVQVVKQNQIIPQIIKAGPHYDYGYIISHGGVSAHDNPEHCPVCNGPVVYKENDGVIKLYCDNPNCKGKSLNKLDHFAGKKGLDIVGLSKATLQKLIDWEWITTISDLFTLKNKKSEWIKKPGFGVASVNKVLNAIDSASKCTTAQYICALGIPNVGKTASKAIADKFKSYESFREAVKTKDKELYNIAGIGEIIIDNIFNFNYTEFDEIFDKYITEIKEEISIKGFAAPLKDLTFVITGKLHIYKNRDELKKYIEENGGKVVNAISGKTNYLINNDINSTTSKNVKAKEMNIPIITEEDLQNLVAKKLELYENF